MAYSWTKTSRVMCCKRKSIYSILTWRYTCKNGIRYKNALHVLFKTPFSAPCKPKVVHDWICVSMYYTIMGLLLKQLCIYYLALTGMTLYTIESTCIHNDGWTKWFFFIPGWAWVNVTGFGLFVGLLVDITQVVLSWPRGAPALYMGSRLT